MKKVDFIIGGFSRSGSTTLANYINQAEGVFMPDPNQIEPKFFSRENLYEKGGAWYAKTFFADAPQGSIKGEKSTEYIESYFFPFRLKKYSEKTKLILIVRDPFERLLSNFLWSIKNGFETRSLTEALLEEYKKGIEPNGAQIIFNTRPHCYIGRSLYCNAVILSEKIIGRQNLLLISYHNFIQSNSFTLKTIQQFLGIKIIGRVDKIVYENRKTSDEHLKKKLFNEIPKNIKNLIQQDYSNLNRLYEVF